MKIGIITFHRAQNYGAVLQMFALQEYLKNLGHSVEFIDYRNQKIENNYKLLAFHVFLERKNVFKSFQIFKNRLLTYSIRKRKAHQFSEFNKNYLQISDKVYGLESTMPVDYDVYITGSDQVWNSTITGGVDKNYYLNFPVNRDAIKIAYAASTEKYNYPFFNENKSLFNELFSSLDAISVREQDVAEIVRTLTDKSVEVVLDPTLLLEQSDYDSIISTPLDTNYVLVYHLGWKKELIEIAETVAKDKGLKIIEMHAGVKPFLDKGRHKQDLSPKDFLGYIKNASFVITTSFHGTAFSLIFKKDFYVFDNGAAMRQYSLLKSLGIENRLIKNKSEIDWNKTIDFESVNEKLVPLKIKSKSFLNQNIS